MVAVLFYKQKKKKTKMKHIHTTHKKRKEENIHLPLLKTVFASSQWKTWRCRLHVHTPKSTITILLPRCVVIFFSLLPFIFFAHCFWGCSFFCEEGEEGAGDQLFPSFSPWKTLVTPPYPAKTWKLPLRIKQKGVWRVFVLPGETSEVALSKLSLGHRTWSKNNFPFFFFFSF